MAVQTRKPIPKPVPKQGPPVLKSTPYLMWKKKDGTIIAVKDMDDQHLLNSIRMLERYAENKSRQYGMDQPVSWTSDEFYDFESDMFLPPVHAIMVSMAAARGIDLSRPCAWVDPDDPNALPA